MENHRQISKVRLLGSTLAGAIGVLTFVSSAASAAPIILMSPSVNDGSFESVASTIQAPTTLVSGWSLTDTVANNGGLLFATNGVLAGANGDEAVFADLGQTTATFPSLLSTGYTSVHASDVFAWSFDVNSWHAASSATLQLKFSASDIVTLATGTAQDTNTATFVTYSGTYTATATDAAAGGLGVIFKVNVDTNGGAVYGDNINISVTQAAVPEPMSLTMFGVGLLGTAAVRSYRRRRAQISL